MDEGGISQGKSVLFFWNMTGTSPEKKEFYYPKVQSVIDYNCLNKLSRLGILLD